MLTSDCLGCGQECRKPCPFFKELQREVKEAKKNDQG